MSLTDGDVAALARQAVDAIDPDLDIRIDPVDPVDPYRFGTSAWTVSAGGASTHIAAGMTAEEALDRLVRDLGSA